MAAILTAFITQLILKILLVWTIELLIQQSHTCANNWVIDKNNLILVRRTELLMQQSHMMQYYQNLKNYLKLLSSII